jgi:hypothetical protein
MLESREGRELMFGRSQGETNGVFTLTNFQIFVQKMKISSPSKT